MSFGYVLFVCFCNVDAVGRITSMSKRWGFEVKTSSVVQAIQGPSSFSSIGMSDMPMLKSGRGEDFEWSKFGVWVAVAREIEDRMDMA